jgi:hypothetical protein
MGGEGGVIRLAPPLRDKPVSPMMPSFIVTVIAESPGATAWHDEPGGRKS